MSRPRAALSSTDARPRVRVRSWAEPLLAAAMVLVALYLVGARSGGAELGASHSGPSFHAGSHVQLVDATLRRIDVQVRRDRVWVDLPPLPLASGPSAAPRFPDFRGAIASLLGPGRDPGRDLRLSHFRRRIPRMNSEDPPCG